MSDEIYHPVAALYRLSLKPATMADFAKLPALLKEACTASGRGNEA